MNEQHYFRHKSSAVFQKNKSITLQSLSMQQTEGCGNDNTGNNPHLLMSRNNNCRAQGSSPVPRLLSFPSKEPCEVGLSVPLVSQASAWPQKERKLAAGGHEVGASTPGPSESRAHT